MSALDDIRTALATALGSAGLKSYKRAPGEVAAPAAVVAPDGIEYNADFDGGATYQLPVVILVAQGDWSKAQESLDAYVSHDGSAVAAINDAEGIEARVTAMSEYGIVRWGTTDYFGASLNVEVLT